MESLSLLRYLSNLKITLKSLIPARPMPFTVCVLVVVFIACLFAPSYSVAADPQTSFDEIVVTASRYDENVANVPANVTVINEERIRNSTAQNIPDLLRTEAGVQVSDMSGNRRSFNVDIRGFGETGLLNTLVLVDGRRVNQSDLSGTDWAQISLDRVQRIEIIRGGRGGVLYGDNASGGVINIITKEGDKLKAGAEAAAGSYGTYRSNAFAGGPVINSLPFYVSGNYMTSAGYRKNSNLETKDAGINVSYLGIKDLKISLSSGYHQDNNRLPGALKESDLASGLRRTDTTHPNDYSNTEDYYIKVTPEYFIGNIASLKMDMSYRKRTFVSFASGDQWNFQGNSGIDTIALSPSSTVKTDLTEAISNRLIAGADYQRSAEDIRNSSMFFGFLSTGDFRLRKANCGAYIQDEVVIAKTVFLSGGFRRDRADFMFSPSSPDKISMQTNAYNGGINFRYMGKSYAYIAYSKSFRYPVLDELYSFYNNTINTALKIQTTENYEIGTRYYFADAVFAHLNFYRSDTRAEINYNPLTYNNENLPGIARRNGAEVSISAKVMRDLLVRGSYTYVDARISGGMFSGRQVPNVPQHTAGAEGNYSPLKDFTIILNGNYVGTRRFISDFSNDFTKQKGYFVMNNKYKYKWKNTTVFLDINNITNQKYAEYGVIGGFPAEKAYYPSQGINFIAGLSFLL
jgi:iron complex outermembrane receptor protein